MFENRAHWADKAFWWIAPIVVLASAGGGLYYYFHSKPKAAAEIPVAQAPAAVAETSPPAIKHPVPGPEGSPDATKPLPALTESDGPLQEALAKLFGAQPIQKMLIPDGLVRRIVVTVDNLPRQKLAVEKRPVKALEGSTVVETQADTVTLSAANYVRYAPLVRLAGSMDSSQLAQLYFRFYPLFQQAYEDLGYPGQYFNDRLVETIDNLLATPDLNGPVALTQPRVFYEYADPKLEARPAGQKLLMRMGRENAAVIKEKLRVLRKAIVVHNDSMPAGSDRQSGEVVPPRTGIVSPPGGMHHWL